jgi:hypothetical protein
MQPVRCKSVRAGNGLSGQKSIIPNVLTAGVGGDPAKITMADWIADMGGFTDAE